MIDIRALKAEIVRNGYNQADVATAIGISARTFTRRLQQRDFGMKEIEAMIDFLKIQKPADIFFA